MSVHRSKRPDGTVRWRVRWRDGGRGSRARTRTFDRKRDAVAFDDELRRRRRLGELGILVGSRETLDKYVTDTWAADACGDAGAEDGEDYALLYDCHIAPYLGRSKLPELTPEIVARWQADRIAAGAGRMSVLKRCSCSAASCSERWSRSGSRATRCGSCERRRVRRGGRCDRCRRRRSKLCEAHGNVRQKASQWRCRCSMPGAGCVTRL